MAELTLHIGLFLGNVNVYWKLSFFVSGDSLVGCWGLLYQSLRDLPRMRKHRLSQQILLVWTCCCLLLLIRIRVMGLPSLPLLHSPSFLYIDAVCGGKILELISWILKHLGPCHSPDRTNKNNRIKHPYASVQFWLVVWNIFYFPIYWE